MTLLVFRKYDPDIGPWVPGASAVVPQQCRYFEAGLLESTSHLGHGQCPERERETVNTALSTSTLGEFLVEDRQPAFSILPHGLDQRDMRTTGPVPLALQADSLAIFLPRREIGDELYPECPARSQDSTDLGECGGEIAIVQK